MYWLVFLARRVFLAGIGLLSGPGDCGQVLCLTWAVNLFYSMYVAAARAKVVANVKWVEPVDDWFVFNLSTSLVLYTDFLLDEDQAGTCLVRHLLHRSNGLVQPPVPIVRGRQGRRREPTVAIERTFFVVNPSHSGIAEGSRQGNSMAQLAPFRH